ncbi:MAG: phosphotransferase, partial [Muribaculaceae bacterium]|nr:phosphotransferase [Muribaculaceae bacterium]
RRAEKLTSIPDEFCVFMMRDFQSRNVMVTDKGPVFIDFQGGRRGPALYDAVSMLWQARAGFSNEFRMEMLDFYCDSFCGGNQVKKQKMLTSLNDIIIFRTLQVLGAYGFRGLVQRKAHFILSIPGALSNLRDLLREGALDEYQELKRCAVTLTADDKSPIKNDGKSLTVEVFSFSYKKGYPEDNSGNGGGFMFDCRGMHNPGRYKRYKELTGRDRDVVDFLENCGEAQRFLKNAWSLTDATIERYVARGFTRLQIGFGCTGGQHRSVYCAERTTSHIREMFPEVDVCLLHREHPE